MSAVELTHSFPVDHAVAPSLFVVAMMSVGGVRCALSGSFTCVTPLPVRFRQALSEAKVQGPMQQGAGSLFGDDEDIKLGPLGFDF